jgi:uncharacterized phage protein gp47/JayE
MAIEIKSFNQILGDMIRKIIAETPLNDVNAGSVLLTLLEACAANDFENNVAILNVLELLNIDAVRNNDLDARAADYGLTRYTATKASGAVSLLNSSIVKQSSGLYVIKPAPISGQTTIYVNNTTGWAASGTLYIGRGTTSFEGPIPYTSIVVFPTYSQVNLGSALQKDHLISDIVVNSQGQPDIVVSSGNVVKIPANNQNPEILYVTLRDAIIPSGETEVDNVQVIAQVPGSQGNALINTITQFDTIPFTGAAVTNTSSFSDGADVETDTQLRNRIKAYSTTLARGTAPSIIQAVLGTSDPVDNKQVVSAVITEPVTIGEPSILYIDDGSGFQPSYAGQSVDVLLSNANGTEQYLQLANFPLPRPQVVNTAIGPYSLSDSMFLRVAVDGAEDTVNFSTSDFVNISAATIAEIVVAINGKSTLFKARLANNSASILIYPVAFDAEVIQVVPLRDTDIASLYVNTILKFPTNEFSYIALYQNSTKLTQKNKTATLETLPFASWNITGTGNLIVAVDGTPAQNGSFSLGDFAGASSFLTLALSDWVTAFNAKFAGITAVATPSQTMQISSNKVGSGSILTVSGGSYLNQMFANQTLSATGQTSQFEINRETGHIKILTTIAAGDTITAGVADAKGFAISSSTTSGTYNVASDSAGRPAEMVILVDSSMCDTRAISLLVGATISISDQGSSRMRIMSSTLNAFSKVQPGDFIYIANRTIGWLSASNTGIFKVVARGPHLTADVDSYVEVLNATIVPELSIPIADATDIRGFITDGYPQIWRGTYTGNPPAASISDIVNSLNSSILGVNATIFRSNSIKLTSATEDSGSIAIPISVGNAGALFTQTATTQTGNQSQIANRVSDKSLIGFFKRTPSTSSNVWLDRDTYASVTGPLSANAIPDSPPFAATYSETVQSTGVLTPALTEYSDIVTFTRGNNKGISKNVAAEIVTDSVGTQQGTPRTEFDHIAGDELTLMQSLKFSADDSIVFILDNKPSTETIDIKMARTGQVNSGSNAISFTPTSTEFSANDSDNEPGIDFGNANVWSTTINKTNFNDYAVLMRARNWYASGGVSGTDGKLIVRNAEYGANGNNMQFAIGYPQTPSQANTFVLKNTPSNNLFTYYFGSNADRATVIASGSNMSVSGPYPDSATNFPNGAASSGNYYDYTFSSGIFTSVQVNDVLSIIPSSGISSFNRGQFGIKAISGNTIRVFNPNGSVTSPGSPEISVFTTIADVIGTPTNVTMTVTSAATLDGTYLVAYDNAGTVKIWFDVDNNGTPEPASPVYNRTIKIATLLSADTITDVATKIAAYLSNDVAFTGVFSTATQVLYTLAQNGPEPTPFNGAVSPGFSYINTPGLADVSLNGEYFTIYDDVGSVAVWFDVDDRGTQEPFHGKDRSIRVYTINSGDNATTVAAAIAAIVNPDSKFSASSVGNQLTITTSFNANTTDASVGTSGFSVVSTSGSLSTSELIVNAGQLHIFPLLNTTVTDITTSINGSNLLTAAAVGNPALTIVVSTAEESYTYGGNSTALGYGHNPTSSSLRGQINLYDGVNWIKMFANANPNFTLKTALTLNGVAPSVYSMNTAPNDDLTTGEYIKLVPTTVKNVQHHFTQKALSQLPIISSVAVSNAGKNVQVKSDNLGSTGAIEVVGGQANKAAAYIIGESEVSSDISGNHLLLKISAFPDTFSAGDIVKVENATGVKRLSRLSATDTINVTNPSANTIEYNFNPKSTNFISSTSFTISDVSATYSRPAGTVWRWTHGGGGATLAQVKAGDLVMASGSLSASWAQGNKVKISGDARVAGLPIINVNDGANWFDVVNPYGKAMSSTTMGSGTVQICPTPIIKWNLDHAARAHIISMVRATNVITVICDSAHMLNSGDSVSIIDSNNLADGVYSSVTVTSPTQFTFASIGANFSEADVKASALNAGATRTRYRMTSMGFNGLTKLSRQDGNSPRFTDCGVAVDDYISISGSTFSSNNNGLFRVLAVDNNSIIFTNSNSVDQIITTIKFNNKGLEANWTANSNIVTGVAGTFKYVTVGDWVKKNEDTDARYLQVTSMSPGTPALATSITLGGNYSGITSTSGGTAYDQTTGYDTGVYLQNIDDIAFYEGDSIISGDTLFVQNIVNTNWFNVNNTGNFSITQHGTNGTTYKPFLRITNGAGVAQSNVQMSVSVTGLYIIESITSKFSTYRQINNAAIDELNNSRRSIYLTPSSRQYKFSEANNTLISHVGKLGYNTDVTIGIDGYLYYTGLLQRVQRIVDGFEPDPTSFPGMRAVGGLIETLPPLIKNIILSIAVTTTDGVNIGDVSNNVKSAIINYIESLGVGQDVVLSAIIEAVMQIKGVGAVTFTNPIPSTERITVANNEKATISPANIGIA